MKNQFDLAAKNFEKEIISKSKEEKIVDMFSDKSFSERYKTTKTVANLTSIVTNVISISTFSFLIGFLVYNMLLAVLTKSIALYVAVGIGLIVGVCFELIKNAAYKNFLIDFYKYKTIPVTGTIIVLALSAASISSSFIGATLIPSATLEDTSKYDFSNYDNQKNILLSQLEDAEKGRFTKTGAKQIDDIQKELTSLSEERAMYTEIITKEKEGFIDEKQSVVSYLGYFSIFSELIYILCYAFTFYCLYRTYVELMIEKSKVVTRETQIAQNNPSAGHDPMTSN